MSKGFEKYITLCVHIAKINVSKHRNTNIIASRERCPLIRKMHLQTKKNLQDLIWILVRDKDKMHCGSSRNLMSMFLTELAILYLSIMFLFFCVFLDRPFWIFFSAPWKSVTNFVIEWMGLNFNVFPGFQQIPSYA